MSRFEIDEPTRAEIDKVVRCLRIRKTGVREKSGEHVIADCPSCGKAKHFYCNVEKGLWDCKRCAASGNLWQLADMLGIRVRERALVRSAASYLMQGHKAAEDAKPPRKVRDVKGMSLEKVTEQCEKIFSDDSRASKVLEYLEERGFDEQTIRHFKLGMAVLKHEGGKEIAVGIPYIEDGKVPLVKMRNLARGKEKRRYARTKGGHSGLFNVEGVRDRKQVVLVEGELDAVSLWQLGITNVASTSLGAKKDIPQSWKEALSAADEIVLWYDDDEAGDEAVQGLITALGSHRCRIATFDGSDAQERMCGMLKDANDLLNVVSDEIDHDTVAEWARDIISKAKGIENTVVVTPSAYADAIANEIELGEKSLGLPTQWASLDKLVRGWRTKELTVVTGHTSHGKSTWLTSACDMLAATGEPVLMSAFEGGPAGVARKIFQRKYGRPISSITTDDERFRARECLGRLNENPIYLIDAYGRTPINTIIDACTYARHRLGVRYVMLDHLHYFLSRPPGIDEREYIDEVTMRLVDLTRELDIGIWLVCHPAGRVDGGTIPTGDSLKGSSSIKQNADNGITVFRAMDLLGDPTPRKMKLRDAQGKRVEVELSPYNALLYVWKARHDDARTGSVIFDFSPRDLVYTDPGAGGQAAEEETQQEKDPFQELPF